MLHDKPDVLLFHLANIKQNGLGYFMYIREYNTTSHQQYSLSAMHSITSNNSKIVVCIIIKVQVLSLLLFDRNALVSGLFNIGRENRNSSCTVSSKACLYTFQIKPSKCGTASLCSVQQPQCECLASEVSDKNSAVYLANPDK